MCHCCHPLLLLFSSRPSIQNFVYGLWNFFPSIKKVFPRTIGRSGWKEASERVGASNFNLSAKMVRSSQLNCVKSTQILPGDVYQNGNWQKMLILISHGRRRSSRRRTSWKCFSILLSCFFLSSYLIKNNNWSTIGWYTTILQNPF